MIMIHMLFALLSKAMQLKFCWIICTTFLSQILLFANAHELLPQHKMFQLCDTSQVGHAFTIPTKLTCKVPLNQDRDKPLTLSVGGIFLLTSKPLHIPALKCIGTEHTVCTNTGFFGSRGIIFIDFRHLTVSPRDCYSANHTKSWQGYNLTESHPNSKTWRTNNQLDITYKWCCTDICHTVTNILIEDEHVTTFDAKLMTSNLGDLGGCHVKQGQCLTHDGLVLWNATQVVDPCPYTFRRIVKFYRDNNFLIFPQLQAAFTIKRKVHILCGQPKEDLYETNQGAFVKLYDHTPVIFTNNQTTDSEPDPEDARLNFLAEGIISQDQKKLAGLYLQLCHQTQTNLDILGQLTHLDPTLGARAILGRTDIIADFTGDALSVWNCTHVNSTRIYYDYSVHKTCYKFLPVLINTTLYFVAPGTNDLLTHSPTVPCQHRPIGIFEHQGKWYTLAGPTHVTLIPMDIKWTGTFTHYDFSKAPLFRDRPELRLRPPAPPANFSNLWPPAGGLSKTGRRPEVFTNVCDSINYCMLNISVSSMLFIL